MNWGAITFLLGAVINSATFAYFYGRLSQRVDDVDTRVTRLENWRDLVSAVPSRTIRKDDYAPAQG